MSRMSGRNKKGIDTKKEVSEWVKNQKNDEIENLDKNEKVNFV